MQVLCVCSEIFTLGFRRKFNACTDERGTVMTELIKGIRVVKMYAWEVPFSKIIDKIRLRECWTLLSGVMIQATIIGLFFAAGKLAIFGTVLAMVYYGGAISASNIFVASALFNLARVTVGLFLPLGLMQWKDISVTLERIEQFMSREEREPSMKVKSGNEKKNIDGVAPYVDIQHLSARYEDDAGSKLDLEDITFTAKAGELITIVGPVGAGKTSVFFSILDENLRVVSGSVSSHGTIAYVPQEAWMFSSTVRKNITFIKEFDALQYSKTIDACDLKEDLKKLEQKDLTVIGDKGAQLSGGQKARVNLARAVYYDADIYLFDDPLSAVDPKVGRHLFDRCINGVLKDKVRILATHQLDYLRAANTIVLINGGKMVDAGSYDELVRRRGAEFFKLLEETEMSYRELAKTPKVRLSSTSSSNVPGTPSRANSVESKVTASMSPRKSIGSPKAEFRTPGREDYADEQAVALLEPVESPELRHADSSWSIQMGNAEEGVNAGDAVDPEDRSTGSISTGIYLRYFLSMGNPVIIAIVMLFSMFVQFVFNMCDWWLNLWATKYEMESAEEMLNFTNLTSCTQKFQSVPSWSSSLSHIDYQNWYIGLVFGLLGTSLLRSICFRAMQVRGSYTLHNKMFRSLIQAPISFFDKTPYGRISNRFTKDMNVMDEQLSFVVFDFLQARTFFVYV